MNQMGGMQGMQNQMGMGQMMGGMGMGGMGMQAVVPVTAAPASTNKVCTFFGSARGCIKAERCDFIHPAGGAGKAVTPGKGQAAAAGPVGTAKANVRYAPY